MAGSENSITRIFNVVPLSRGAQSPSLVSLCLVVHDRRRVLYRESNKTLYMIHDEITGVRPILAPKFDKLDLYRPDAMCTILCDALGLSIDEDSLCGLCSRLANCALATKSLSLCAELEVVHNTVVVSPNKDVELDTCPICLDELCGAGSVSHTQCLHRFHLDCLVKWLEKKKDSYSCPLCRTEL